MFEMTENLSDDDRLFDTGNHLDSTAALLAGFDVDLEHTTSSIAVVDAFAPLKSVVGRKRLFLGYVRRWIILLRSELKPPVTSGH